MTLNPPMAFVLFVLLNNLLTFYLRSESCLFYHETLNEMFLYFSEQLASKAIIIASLVNCAATFKSSKVWNLSDAFFRMTSRFVLLPPSWYLELRQFFFHMLEDKVYLFVVWTESSPETLQSLTRSISLLEHHEISITSCFLQSVPLFRMIKSVYMMKSCLLD